MVLLYQTKGISTSIEVRVEEETVWLNRQQISILYDRDLKTIGRHIVNFFSEGELEKNATVTNFATVQNEGGGYNIIIDSSNSQTKIKNQN